MIANETAARRRVQAAARGRFFGWLVLGTGLLLGSSTAFAQTPAPPPPNLQESSSAKPQESSSTKPQESSSAKPQEPAPPAAKPKETPPAKSQDPAYDPYRAAKDIEIGNFYLRKGDVDAAIDRFLDAIRHKPDFAEPCRLLGEAYEKKDEKAEALKYYREYLRIRPKAPDAGKIRKRIGKLSQEVEQK
jgi:tetratricopeptide (TPR) repeat protein